MSHATPVDFRNALEPNCKTCMYFFPDSSEAEPSGLCRRRAPVALVTERTPDERKTHDVEGVMFETSWPVVMWNDWCGDYDEEEFADP